MRHMLASMLAFSPLLLAAGCAQDAPQILTVTAVSPASVIPSTIPGGSADPFITVSGTLFSSDLQVVLGSTAVPTTLVSSTSLQVQVPAALRVAGAAYSVAVRQNNGVQGNATLATPFTVSVVQPHR